MTDRGICDLSHTLHPRMTGCANWHIPSLNLPGRLTEADIVARREAELQRARQHRVFFLWGCALAIVVGIIPLWHTWLVAHLPVVWGILMGSAAQLFVCHFIDPTPTHRPSARTPMDPDVIEDRASRPNPL